MDEITELAGKLGKAIAGSPQAAKLSQAREAMDADPATAQLVKDYNAQAARIAELEAEQKPVEVPDKHKLQELQGKLVASEAFKAFTAAQVEYAELMNKVNDGIRGNLTDIEPD